MKRSKFSLSHYKLISLNMGKLVPIGLTEVLPGDTVQQATSALVRVSPLVSPVMHPVHVRIHHWYVPFRLLWDEWEDFITGGPSGDFTPDFPVIGLPSISVGSLFDYFGVPPGTHASNFEFSALPFRAYAKIFNEWYRDQDLVTEVALSTASGNDSQTNQLLLNVAWEKDYFTTARPWPQKGPDIVLPLGDKAPVVGSARVSGIGVATSNFDTDGITVRETGPGFSSVNTVYPRYYKDGTDPASGPNAAVIRGRFDSATGSHYPNIVALFGGSNDAYADLSQATAVSVNDLREAFALQRFEEARARYGSRYTEYLRYLGVRSSDSRLQRPEYLGGGRQTIQFSEVLQTAPGDGGVASLFGHGIGALRSNRYRRFFEEHGYIVSLMSVLPKTIYQQGLHRTFNRRIKEDFWQRELQHIGQQEILNQELYVFHPQRQGVFGYQDRYDEYRRAESGVAGEFRNSLNYWHFAREFANSPALNADFVTSNPTNRPFADRTSDTLHVMVNHSIQARRLVSKTGSSFIK